MWVSFFNKKNNTYSLLNFERNLKTEISRQLYDLLTLNKIMESNPRIERFIYGNHKREKFPQENKLGMFNCTLLSDNFYTNDSSKKRIIFFGFPYDNGASQKKGAKFGPYTLRNTSGAIGDKKTVLEGTSFEMYDFGDVKGDVFFSNGDEFDYIENIVEYLVCSNDFPIMIGGDHSISLASLKGVCNSVPRFGIIHLDAHQDYFGEATKSWRTRLHHGNFLDWIVNQNEVSSIIQLGIRTTIPIHHKKINSYSVDDTLEHLDEILGELDKDIPYYLTFDVDCLSTSIMKSTGTPIPGGFEFREVQKILTKIAQSLTLIGADIVELTDYDSLDAYTVNQLLFDFLYQYIRSNGENVTE